MMFVSGRRLKIDEARVNDSGWYSCEGFNHYGHQSTTAYLHIRHGTIGYPIDSCTVQWSNYGAMGTS